MSSGQLWNSHQRHKFWRAQASRDILKFRVLEMAFPGLFKRYFPLRTPYVALSEYMQDWEQCHQNVPDLNVFKYAFNVIQNWETYGLQYCIQWCLFFVSSYGRRR